MFSNSPKIRQGIYIIAVAAQVASFFVAIVNAELAAAFLSASGVLAAVAGVTALTNVHANAIVDPYDNGLGALPASDGV